MPTKDESKPAGIEFYGGYEVSDENGIDLTLLRSRLERTIEERWNSAHSTAAFARALRDAGAKFSGINTHKESRAPVIDACQFILHLAAYQVEFVVIGGFAMLTHGSAHITEDLDLCYRSAPIDRQRLAAALKPLHPRLRGEPRERSFDLGALALQANLNFSLATDHGDLDLRAEVSGVGDYEQVFDSSIAAEMFGAAVRILSLDELIASKKAVNRCDNHLLELEALKKLRDAGPQGA